MNVGEKLFIDVSFENSEDTLAGSSKYPCDPALDLTFDDCLDDALPRALAAEFGCTLPYVPAAAGEEGVPVCDPADEELRSKVFARYKDKVVYIFSPSD